MRIKLLALGSVLVAVFAIYGISLRAKQNEARARAARVSDVQGNWTGSWSWEPSQRASIAIDGSKCMVSNLPENTLMALDPTNFRVVTDRGWVVALASSPYDDKMRLTLRLPSVKDLDVDFLVEADGDSLLLRYTPDRGREVVFRKNHP